MSAEDDLTAAITALVQSMMPTPSVQRGKITDIQLSLYSFIVTVDLGYSLTVMGDGFSGPFLAELNAAKSGTGIESLVGRKVEVTFSAGQQAAIAYTVGV